MSRVSQSEMNKNKLHSKNKKYFQAPFLVLQFVTNRGLMSLSGEFELTANSLGVHIETHRKLILRTFS